MFSKIRQLSRNAGSARRRFKRHGRKVFCIGRNKTGTTSLSQALKQFGYQVGRQRDAEFLIEDWMRRDFRRLISYCRTADAFQDVPFSLDYTFQAVDAAFPGSKFILTLRDSADQWYQSLIRFHKKLLGTPDLPTADELKKCEYVFPGWLWRCQQVIYGADAHTLYDEVRYKAHYARHTEHVQEYFRHRPSDLLVVNLANHDSIEQLCKFVGASPTGRKMPHLNRSDVASVEAASSTSDENHPTVVFHDNGHAGSRSPQSADRFP